MAAAMADGDADSEEGKARAREWRGRASTEEGRGEWRARTSALEEAGARGGKAGAPPAHGLHVLATRRPLEPDVEHVVCIAVSNLESMFGPVPVKFGPRSNYKVCCTPKYLQVLFKGHCDLSSRS
jgi:hypothetical protein